MLNGAVDLDDVRDMDFLTFDDLLRQTLRVDAMHRLDLLRIVNYGAQGNADAIKDLQKQILKVAYPDGTQPQTNPNGGMRGLKSWLSQKGVKTRSR